ncbi:MAG: cytochrome C oxidase subunit IV family protein [Phycisphaerales bacterium]|nr:cytochrome C oxidase subunit IV family protein [Phycisphaerales bacterium]
MNHNAQGHAAGFDPNDPHHFSDLGEHHGHHITPTRTLLMVLGALLFCTALTVVAAEVERYAVFEMGWQLPHWVNIAVAMSIATVKALLVIAFFMALKYENPLYTIIFLFCIFAFALFLGLTGMELDNRGHLYAWKQPAIHPGGTGVNMPATSGNITVEGEKLSMEVDAFNNASLTENLKKQYIEEQHITEDEYWERWAEANHVHPKHDHALSDANHSVPRRGLSGALDTHAPEAPAAGTHGSEH